MKNNSKTKFKKEVSNTNNLKKLKGMKGSIKIKSSEKYYCSLTIAW